MHEIVEIGHCDPLVIYQALPIEMREELSEKMWNGLSGESEFPLITNIWEWYAIMLEVEDVLTVLAEESVISQSQMWVLKMYYAQGVHGFDQSKFRAEYEEVIRERIRVD